MDHRYTLDPVLHSVGGVGDLIADAVARHGPRVAFLNEDRQITYAEFGEDVSRTMQFLTGLGLQRGDAVLQLSANSYEMFLLMAACNVGGFVSVTPNYSSGIEDHRHILDDCGAVLIVADAARAGRAADFALQVGAHAFCHGAGTALSHIWPAIRKFGAQPLEPQDRPGDIVRLIYTGGTTGRPKGVVTLSSQLAFASLLHIAEQGFSTATRFLVLSPISHGGGSFIIPVLCRGGSVVIEDGFDAGRMLETVSRLQVTTLFLVPTMIYMLMDDPRIAAAKLESLTRIVYAASPISPPRLQQALSLFGPIFSQNYGLTEVPGTVMSLSPEDHIDGRASRLASSGKPYPCVIVRLLDEGGAQVLPGAVGEICVRAPHATPGYWNKPEQTAALWQDGWLHTGDLAYQGENDYFYIVDRKKDMIISGGFNVYPQEVENVLSQHPAVLQATVIGVPHPKWGEAVHAVVVLHPGQLIGETELIEFVKRSKGAVMAPKSVSFINVLPLTALGKIDKQALRAPFWLGQSRLVM